MPAARNPRQVGVATWFETDAAQRLLRAERPWLLERLGDRPAQPWLWLAPVPFRDHLPVLPGIGLRLCMTARGDYAGDLRCTLPLPLPDACLQAIVLQHVAGLEAEQLLAECERVLMPGGKLWLLALNPLSPYRWRWRRRDLAVRMPFVWRLLLQRSGLSCVDEVRYLGPVWRGGGSRSRGPAALAATCALSAEKRTPALIGPIPLPAAWPAAAVPAV